MRLAAVMAVAALGLAGCDPGEIDLEDRACPCVHGWVCDPVRDVCVRSGDGGTALDAGRDAQVDRDARPIDALAPFDAGPLPADAGPDAGPPPRMDGGPPPLEPPWWDTSFGYRAQMTVENSGGVDAPAALPVALSTDISMLPTDPNKEQLRVLRWDATARTWSVLDFAANWVSVSAETPIWFGLGDAISAGETDGSYWLYWANDAASDGRRPSNVFAVWSQLSAISTSAFSMEDPYRLASSGELVLERGGSIRTTMQFGPGYAVDWVMRVPTFSGYFWGGFQRRNDIVDGDPWIIWINRDSDPNKLWPEVKISAIGHATPLEGSHLSLDGAEHYYSVERYLARAVFVRDYAEVSVIPFGADYTTPMQIRIRSSPESGPEMFVDSVRVRPVIRPMPTVTLGAPEALP